MDKPCIPNKSQKTRKGLPKTIKEKKMKLEDVTEIWQSAEWLQVNKKLKEGFKIIRIFNSRAKTLETETIAPIYVLGRIGE